MANVRIDPNGAILKDNQVVPSDNRTMIGDDGTIVSTSIGGSAATVYRGGYNAPPSSPLEGGSRRDLESAVTYASQSQAVGFEAIREKEYDIQMMEGRIKNAFPKKWMIVTIALCVIAVTGLYYLFIPAIVTGIMVFAGIGKKRELEAERDLMVRALEQMKGENS